MSTSLSDRAPAAAHDFLDRQRAQGFRFDPTRLGGTIASRGEAGAEAAIQICLERCAYQPEGRGPLGFDDLGFVRCCVQAAVDWEVRRLRNMGLGPLCDLVGYGDAPVDPTRLGRMVEEWGMVRVGMARDLNLSKAALAGDVMLYLGEGPRLGLVIAPWRETPRFPNFESPAVAYVWPGQPPKTARDSRLGWSPLALYRWPEMKG